MSTTTAHDVRSRLGVEGPVEVLDLYEGAAGEMYDDIAATDRYEVAEIVAAVRRTRGPVLELAAGSGRLTLSLVRLGRPVSAVDSSADMLRLLGDRLAVLPARTRERCTLLEGDMARLDALPLAGPVGAVVLATTSITLLDGPGRRRLFRSVSSLLAPGGRFVLTLLDDAAEGGGEVEVAGASGRRYLLRETASTAPDGGPARTVTLRPAEPPAAGPLTVGVSTVAVLDSETVLGEMRAAGLRVHRTDRIESSGPHASLLVEAGR